VSYNEEIVADLILVQRPVRAKEIRQLVIRANQLGKSSQLLQRLVYLR